MMSFRRNATSEDSYAATVESNSRNTVNSRRRKVEINTIKRRKSKVKFQRLSVDRQMANGKERRRAQRIREGFANLVGYVAEGPHEERRLSRVEILKQAVDYIRHLEDLLGIRRGDGLQSSASAASPITPPVSADGVLQRSASADVALLQRLLPAGLDSSLRSSTAKGKVPTNCNEYDRTERSSCHLDISRIDFDIDEDFSDIPGAPEGVYNDFQSTASSMCNTDASSTVSSRLPPAELNHSSPEPPNSSSPSRFIYNFPHNQKIGKLEPAWCELLQGHTPTPPPLAHPLAASPCHVGLVPSTNSSTTSARVLSPVTIPAAPGVWRTSADWFLYPMVGPSAKSIQPTTSDLCSGYCTCHRGLKLKFHSSTAYPCTTDPVPPPTMCLQRSCLPCGVQTRTERDRVPSTTHAQSPFPCVL